MPRSECEVQFAVMDRTQRAGHDPEVLAIPLELPAVRIYMIWHEIRRNDAAHTWLREFVVAELGRTAKGYLSSNSSRARSRPS